jgi:PilZ domain
LVLKLRGILVLSLLVVLPAGLHNSPATHLSQMMEYLENGSWNVQKETGKTGGDRRADRRYEISLELRWKLIRRRQTLDTGSGRTVDISSGGILFEANRPLPVGRNVELSINWPALLRNVTPLQLIAYGRIVRSEGHRTAMQMSQHEFKTLGTDRGPGDSPGPRAPV